MTDLNPDNVARPLRMRDELNAAVNIALPQTPGQFGARLIKEKWGADIDPQSASLVTLDYDYKGHPARDGIHQGQVASSQSLLQALLSNYQTVGDGRFAETAFGLYTPPDIGPCVRIVQHVDEFADHGSGNHQTYEGIYRQTIPQAYGPSTQITLKPADFKKWVWEMDLQGLYKTYLDQAWPTDAALMAPQAYGLRTSVKAAFVMSAWLQRQEQRLSEEGRKLAMQAAGLPLDQAWETLSTESLQASTRIPPMVTASRLRLYRYTATDIWIFRVATSPRVLMYIPGNSSPLHDFADVSQLHQWVVKQSNASATKQALASHFIEDDRQDGTFHAGVLTALDGMANYPRKHWLTNNAGFFNNDGYWDPAEYIGFDDQPPATDPFAQLVLTMKQAAWESVKTIRDDAQVNRDNLSAVVEPVVQWINRFGPLALFVPGGEGVLALAGLIDAGYGLDQAVNGETSSQRKEGVTRTVFGLLNALPLAGAAANVSVGKAEAEALTPSEHVTLVTPAEDSVAAPASLSRLELIRGIGPSVASFGDEVLAQIAKVSAVDDDMLRLMNAGRPPTPLLADTISRFKLDQELGGSGKAGLFNGRYAALQQSTHKWVRLFQRQYPGLPKSAIEQMLDRYGVDIHATPDVSEVKQVFKRLDSKARQYQQHVRLNRAYEGFYLGSIDNPETDTLALHSLAHLPGWPKDLRIDILDRSPAGRVLDRSGPLDAAHCRSIIRVGNRYQRQGMQSDFYEAVLGILSVDERSALHLISDDSANELRRKVAAVALPRSQTLLGLQRMDSGLTFEPRGLRGGGYPSTPQGAAMTHEMMRLQIKEIYPDFTDTRADEALQRAGNNTQAYIDGLKLQLQQLNTDLSSWVDQAAEDVHDMELGFLAFGDEAAQGLTPAQVATYNVQLLMEEMADERTLRTELAQELTAIWQQRGTGPSTTLDMNFENYHRLPALNVRFDDVTELLMKGFHLTEQDSLNGFLESFPNLEILNLDNVDLRHFFVAGDTGHSLPPAMGRLTRLRSLHLQATQLVFTDSAASQLRDLTRLQTLDLSDNPLGVPPLVMGMNDLRQLNLRNTQITRCPIGIREEPYLTSLDLRDNQITRVPPAVINQAVEDDYVLLLRNPLTDEDTLRRLVSHREETGVNLWLSVPGAGYGTPMVWLRDCDEALQQSRTALWQRLADKPSGTRFLAVMDRLSLTADFRVCYVSLQTRVWRLLNEADASEEMWDQLSRSSGRFDHPMAAFRALEERASL
ncbi:hypothetical protein BK660_02090 [Pseudomonas brassicacearum]|uniref:RING-type E3 ubiquitin transferase n=1 Tax=Pseudomonas brassicacearum TaxID=930166 RepID=A0A423IGB0_9PSED|nr:DUF6543 domain-containing protein [Pseudomonas brassicacearum]RON24484.1 hypothetical protein BK660_02090 [Pseudomonas brassicacearum]